MWYCDLSTVNLDLPIPISIKPVCKAQDPKYYHLSILFSPPKSKSKSKSNTKSKPKDVSFPPHRLRPPSTAQSSPSYNARLPANQALSLHIPRYTNARYATNVYTVQYSNPTYILSYIPHIYKCPFPLALSTSILNTYLHRLAYTKKSQGNVRYSTVQYSTIQYSSVIIPLCPALYLRTSRSAIPDA
jgi:hypothetical protein